jgi:6-phosphogluconolactonase (cycloisomerase 2 family)
MNPTEGLTARRTAQRSSARRALIVVAAVGVCVALATSVSSAAGTGTASHARSRPLDGIAYVLSNRAKGTMPGNSVLAFHYRSGQLAPVRINEYRTRGFGVGARGESSDGDQQVWTNAAHTLLFAVNQGSDSIAVFHIAKEGTLRAVKGSPFRSRGLAPVSVGVSGNTLIVVNKAADPSRPAAQPPSVVQFKIKRNGRLVRRGAPIPLNAGSSPTQAWVSPSGKLVVVPEMNTGVFDTFIKGKNGTFKRGPRTTITAPETSCCAATGPPIPGGAPGNGLLGLAGHPHKRFLYATDAGNSELMVFSYNLSGKLTFVKGLRIQSGRTVALLPCWDEVTPNGRFLYTGDTEDDTVSAIDISNPANPRVIQIFKLKGPGVTFNVRVDPITGRRLFVISQGTPSQLHMLKIGSTGLLSERADPVAIPIDTSTNAYGLVLVPHRRSH